MADYTVSILLQATDNASQSIQGLKDALQGVSQTQLDQLNDLSNATTAWDNYKNAINNVQTVLGTVDMAMDMLGQGLEFVSMGENVHAVTLAFEALQGGAENAAATLQMVREATSFVIDDTSLMSAINRMQSMGLGDTAEEFAELIGMAQQLGSVMSPNATAAQNIDNFTLLLANQSVRRLDSFGISADAVRQRIEELKDAGYSAQEAFNLATLEQGRIALANLGDAASAGATNVDQLSTSITNVTNAIAEWAAGVTNAAIGTVETLVDIGNAIRASDDAVLTLHRDLVNTFAAYSDLMSEGYAEDFISMNRFAGSTLTDAELMAIYTQQTADAARAYYENLYGTGSWLDDMTADAEAFAAGIDTATTSTESLKLNVDDINLGWQEGSASVTAISDGLKETKNSAAELLTTTEANRDAFLEMERAAISLADVLGTTDGGLGGEISGDVQAYMESQGYSQADIDAYNQQAGLATGQVTQSSLTYENTAIPFIAQIAAQYGAEAAAQATINLQTGMQNAEMAGMTDQEIANNMAGMTGYTQQTSTAMGFQGLGTTEQGTTAVATEEFSPDAYTQSIMDAESAALSIADSSKNAQQSMTAMADSAQLYSDRTMRAVTALRTLPPTHNLLVNIQPSNAGVPAWFREWVLQIVPGGGGGDNLGETIPGTGAGQ